MQALTQRNPTSIMAALARGSNNAGGNFQPATTPNGNRPTGGNPFQQAGLNMNAPTQQGFMGNNMPSFAAGGMMSQGGAPIRPGQPIPRQGEPQLGAAPSEPMAPQQIEQEAQRFMQSQPQQVQQIQAAITAAMQTGELTPDELNQAVQLAKVALANPNSYPQVRSFAIQNGLGTEADIPEQMDQGLLYALLVAGKAMQSAGNNGMPAQGNAVMGQPPAPTEQKAGLLPSYAEGGMTGDRPHIAQVHADEYVVPREALMYHGKKHFDKLVEQARNPDGNKQQ